KLLALGGRDFKVWSSASGAGLASAPRLEGKVRGLAFRPSSNTLATVGYFLDTQFWGLTTRARYRRTFPRKHAQERALSPDGWVLALAGGDFPRGELRLANLETGTERELFGHTQQVSAVAFSPDGKLLASADVISMRLWDVATGLERRRLERPQ